MTYPITRLRRFRVNEKLRTLVRETRLSSHDLILPLFVIPGEKLKKEIPTLPGHFQFSADQLVREVEASLKLGVTSFLLFGLPREKYPDGREAWSRDGTVQKALRLLKKEVPQSLLITDVCLCSYTSDGHCEISNENDRTNCALAEVALSHLEAGADIIAPSDMMDGRIGIIRKHLDGKGFERAPILSYAVKYASAFYGPFREAADSTPQQGDRKGYQMDPANGREALREVALDLEEGADMIMVKPAIPYLDILSQIRQKFDVPLCAYDVSGTYAMVKAAAARGMLDEQKALWENMISIKRAGADIIITYAAKEIAKLLQERDV